MKTRLNFRGIGGRRFPGERLFFEPDRSGTFARIEASDRRRGMFVTLTFEGQI